jgi:hypothetical protein
MLEEPTTTHHRTAQGAEVNDIQRKAKESEAIARESLAVQTDQMLVDTWMNTNGQSSRRAVTILRGWLMDELERRMNALDKADQKSPLYGIKRSVTPRFDRWLYAECSASAGQVVSPSTYLI